MRSEFIERAEAVRLADTSERSFRNRAKEAGDRAKGHIEAGEYIAAALAIEDAIRYDGIAKEYGFIIDALETM